MMYYKVKIEKTGRSSMKDKVQNIGHEIQDFPTLKKAKQFIKDAYGKSKGAPIYVDDNNKSKLVGRVYGFWTQDYEGAKWFQQDWVTISKVSESNVY